MELDKSVIKHDTVVVSLPRIVFMLLKEKKKFQINKFIKVTLCLFTLSYPFKYILFFVSVLETKIVVYFFQVNCA